MSLTDSVFDVGHCPHVERRVRQRPVNHRQTEVGEHGIQKSDDHQIPVIRRTFLYSTAIAHTACVQEALLSQTDCATIDVL